MNVRPMTAADRTGTRAVARRSFGHFAMLFFDFGARTFVVEDQGRIVGGIALGVFDAGRHRDETRFRCGVIKWIFTLPEAQGRGVAGLLLSAALDWFRDQRCTDYLACVEGYNTASSNRFYDVGFRPFGLRAQLKRYGASLARVWLGAFHLLDVGHFLWVYHAEAQGGEANNGVGDARAESFDGDHGDAELQTTGGSAAAWLTTAVLNAVVLSVMVLRTRGADALGFQRVSAILAGVTLVVAVRTAAMLLTARTVGLPVRFRSWETGLTLSAAIALVFGRLFPVPGSVYPRRLRWRYRDLLPQLGPIAAVGAGETLSLAWVLWAIGYFVAPGGWLGVALATAAMYARATLVFDLLIPVFPFNCFNGRRILDWKPLVWGIFTAAAAALFVVAATFR